MRYEPELVRACVDGARASGSLKAFLKDFRACARAFELHTAIRLTRDTGRQFLLYADVAPETKQRLGMSTVDTGIDLCDGVDTIVQCKLRTGTVSLRDCATFFASMTTYADGAYVIAWPNALLARNACSRLSSHLAARAAREPFDAPVEMGAFRAECTRLATPHLPIRVTRKCILRFVGWERRGEGFRCVRYMRIDAKTLTQMRDDGVTVQHRRGAVASAYTASALAYDVGCGFVTL
jgi:hypothetical protein